MIEKKSHEVQPAARMEWIEPAVRELKIDETANGYPRRGNDFQYPYPDCTVS